MAKRTVQRPGMINTGGRVLKLQDKTMKTLATDRALVTAWLLAQGGLTVPVQQAGPAAAAPTAAPVPSSATQR
ncbi:hypothetical protein GCM10027318_09110 [Massilia agilis]